MYRDHTISSAIYKVSEEEDTLDDYLRGVPGAFSARKLPYQGHYCSLLSADPWRQESMQRRIGCLHMTARDLMQPTLLVDTISY